MTSFTRKLKRRQMLAARKTFMRDFKSAMTKFKKQVACSVCGREPVKGESIDNWHIDKYSEKIDLICTNCYDVKEEKNDSDIPDNA